MPSSPNQKLGRLPFVLLVEDDSMVRETIQAMLEDDYIVLAAVSVTTALPYLLALDGPDIAVIVLDCLMPNGDLSDLLAVADRRAIPVVLISGDVSQAEKAGPGHAFLAKPFSQASLLSALDTARS